jgi:hypothetical protein
MKNLIQLNQNSSYSPSGLQSQDKVENAIIPTEYDEIHSAIRFHIQSYRDERHINKDKEDDLSLLNPPQSFECMYQHAMQQIHINDQRSCTIEKQGPIKNIKQSFIIQHLFTRISSILYPRIWVYVLGCILGGYLIYGTPLKTSKVSQEQDTISTYSSTKTKQLSNTYQTMITDETSVSIEWTHDDFEWLLQDEWGLDPS